jgi:hypothetical protein
MARSVIWSCVSVILLPSVLEIEPVTSQTTTNKAEAPSSAIFIRLIDVDIIASESNLSAYYKRMYLKGIFDTSNLMVSPQYEYVTTITFDEF